MWSCGLWCVFVSVQSESACINDDADHPPSPYSFPLYPLLNLKSLSKTILDERNIYTMLYINKNMQSGVEPQPCFIMHGNLYFGTPSDICIINRQIQLVSYRQTRFCNHKIFHDYPSSAKWQTGESRVTSRWTRNHGRNSTWQLQNIFLVWTTSKMVWESAGSVHGWENGRDCKVGTMLQICSLHLISC